MKTPMDRGHKACAMVAAERLISAIEDEDQYLVFAYAGTVSKEANLSFYWGQKPVTETEELPEP